MKQIKEYRPAIAAFLCMIATAFTTTALSFFVVPVCTELGFGRGSFSLYYSFLTIAGAFANTFLGQIVGKKGVRPLALFSGVWVCVCLFLFSFSNALWMFFGSGFLLGIISSNFAIMASNTLVQQSYPEQKAASLLGVVMAGSGVGGVMVSLVLPTFLENIGWRMGYRLLGISWLVVFWLAALVMGKAQKLERHSGNGAAAAGLTKAEAMKDVRMYLMMLCSGILAAACSVQQQIPSILSGHEISAAMVSMMMSAMTAMLAIGKIILGFVYSKIGVRNGGCLAIAAFALGLLAIQFKSMAFMGLILIAFGIGAYSTLLPMATRTVFGTKEYPAIWGVLATASSVGSVVLGPVWGMIFDATGSYSLALILAAVLLSGVILALLRIFRK